MVLPNFVGVGAQRAATSWVYSCLAEHPDVFVSTKKELAFFNRNFDRGLAWYEEQFAGHAGQKAVGEVTPGYMYNEEAIGRMAEVIPGARLFVILREPVARAYSAYQLHPEHYEGMTFREACARVPEYLVGWSLYADRLEMLHRHYRKEVVKVFLYDDIQEAPGAMLADLFRFLDIDPAFRPPSARKIYNRAVYPTAQQALGRWKLGWSIDLVKRTPLAEIIKKAHRSRGRREGRGIRGQIPDEARARFRDDIDRLERIIDRDLSHWK